MIDIAKILKDCPKGTKLYSPLCGECYFDRLNQGTIICKKQNTQVITFTCEGYYMLPVFDGCECLLFPSKENRDWNKFKRPFNDGDIVAFDTEKGTQLFIFKEYIYDHWYAKSAKCYMMLDCDGEIDFESSSPVERFATGEEKQKLFESIKANGYKWNSENKTLEKLIKPKFKVGDRIKYRSGEIVCRIVQITEDSYVLDNLCSIPISIEHMYNLVPNKFDITTLKPFESRVLARSDNNNLWKPAIFGFLYEKGAYMVGGVYWGQVIPYENNEHLLGTTNDCDEYYKTW